MNQCYFCGKNVLDEDLAMKDVSKGDFSTDRKAFHNACWYTYHKNKVRKDAFGYGAVIVFGLLLLIVPLGMLIGTLVMTTLVVIDLVSFVYLLIAYVRIHT